MQIDKEKLLEQVRQQFPGASSITMVRAEGTIIRGDGTVENLGEIGFWHKNPLMRWSFSRKVLQSQEYEEIVKKYKLWKVLPKWFLPVRTQPT